MTVRLFTAALCLCVLAGCPGKPATRCGDLSNFTFGDSCDRSTLAQIPREGVWNALLTTAADSSGAQSSVPYALVFKPDGGLIDNLETDSATFTADTVHLVSSFKDSNGVEYRIAVAGCHASSPTHFSGVWQTCAGDAVYKSGTLEAQRVQRPADELEASHLTLRSELPIAVGQAQSVDVQNGIAYVASRSAVTLIDVHNPDAPVVLSTIAAGNDYWNAARVNGTALYVASSLSGVLVYDVSNPSSPHVVVGIPADGVNSGYGLRLVGNTLYVAAPISTGAVLTMDASAPANPAVVSTFRAFNTLAKTSYVPFDAYPLGNRLYVSYFGLGLVVVDISNPASPQQLGEYQDVTVANPTFTQSAVALQKDATTYAILSDEGWKGHLRTVDVTNPAAMTMVGQWSLGNEISTHNLWLSADAKTLYLAHYQNGLRVLDVSDPVHPTQIAYFNSWRESDANRGTSFFDGLSDVMVPGDGHIYATDLSRGLLILDQN